MICDPSRAASLGQLDRFVSVAGLYARDRNEVKPEHSSVSRLSPAIRHRLITEEEVAAAALHAHPFGRVEKFVQEVYWRRYWKSWLSLRPQVWDGYLGSLEKLHDHPAVKRVESQQSGNPVIDFFSNELVSTGYLHNHARMWFAAWWVHEARLPWQCGAAFFHRHLLDGDPASNILSWRWVAGLQTPGKTYLARRSNLEKYLAPELLASLGAGLGAFENPQPLVPLDIAKPPVTRKDWPLEMLQPSSATGLWIHEEDLSAEHSPLAAHAFSAAIATGDLASWDRHGFPDAKRKWLVAAIQDAATRAGQHWKLLPALEITNDLAESLACWAQARTLDQLAALRPEVGFLHDVLPTVRARLAQAGVRLVLIDRPEDLRVRPFANAGFFQFWERLRMTLVTTPGKNEPSGAQQLSIEFPP